MTVIMVVCDRCGLRVPIREILGREALVGAFLKKAKHWEELIQTPCECGGTLYEDPFSTIAAIRERVLDDS